MAVTRIKNNQITDASNGNTQLGVNAAVKLQNYSVTAGKLANSLVYGSDLTVSGNLTVNGTTTTVDTVNTLIKDPILTLADGQTSGNPVVDIGLLGLRGNQLSSFIGWNEGNTEFAVVLSNTTASNTTVVITEYGNFHANSVTVGGNLSVAGNITGSFNLTGNLTAGNLLTTGLVSATSNVTGGNILTGGLVSATGNATAGNVNTAGLISATGNVTGGNVLTAGLISSTGNLTAGNISTAGNVTAANFIGNISGNIDAAGSNTEIQFNGPGDVLTANANFTYNYATNLMTVNGGNIATGNLSATGNTTSGNVLTGGLVSATGNLTSGNVNTAIVSTTGQIVSTAAGNLDTGGGQIYLNGTGNNRIDFSTAGTGAPAFTTRSAGAKLVLFPNLGNAAADYAFGIDSGTLWSGVPDSTGNFKWYAGTTIVANLSGTGIMSVSGNIIGANILTAGLVSATGNATAGNVLTGGLVSATGNATAGNVLTGGLVSATGNITTSANIVTNNIVGSNVTITSAGILDLLPTGNIAVNSKNINNLADPVQDQDAATKIYVDTVAQGLDIKASVVYSTANTLTNLNGAYTYNNGASGVGATITFSGTGAFTPDGTAVSVGQRILVRDEVGAFVNNTTPSAAFNGIYVVTDAGGGTNAVLTRALDFDNGSPSGEIPGAFTFVEAGSTWADTGWVCTTNNPVTVGTTQIIFTQFSGAGSYTANTSAGISLTGTVFSALVDNNTTAFDGGGNIIVKAGANLTTPNIGNATGNSLILTGNGLIEGTTLSATGNVIGGNITTVGLISATGNATAGNVLTGGLISATGNVNGGNLISSDLVQGVTLSASGNVIGGNVTTVGLITATGNVTGGNVLTAGLVSATGNATAGNLTTGGLITATGNITGGNVLTAGEVSATGNIYGGNISTAGNVTASYFIGNISGNIDAAGSNTEIQFNGPGDILTANANFTYNFATNLMTVNGGNIATGNLSATGNVSGNTGGQFGNIVISGDNITDTNGRVNFNTAGDDVDFAVNGDTVANVFYIDAGTGTASFGSATQTTNAIVAFNATNSILLPSGTLGERPATGVTGMIRFNSTNNGLEIYDNSEWTPVGTTTFTVIADEQFNGDGSTVAFTLSSTQTTNSCIVSINGVVQIPGSAYSVAGTDPTCVLTFTEAPAEGDLIDVREITTTTTVTAISNNSGNAQITGDNTAATMTILGNLVPTANAAYTLGSSTSYWQNVYTANLTFSGVLSGSSLSASGNITGGNLSVGTGTVTTGNIVNSNANGVGNIGSATTYFNTVFAKATSAQYADLAEKYVADAAYAPGTVVSFGGDKEVTQSTVDADRAVAGVVSTNPSYIMNATLEAEHVATIALTGRVPTKVTGTVAKGDLMVSNGDGTARAEQDPRAGAIIGKALENFDGAEGVIEVVIGRF